MLFNKPFNILHNKTLHFLSRRDLHAHDIREITENKNAYYYPWSEPQVNHNINIFKAQRQNLDGISRLHLSPLQPLNDVNALPEGSLYNHDRVSELNTPP